MTIFKANVLVSDSYEAVICDFGESCVIQGSESFFQTTDTSGIAGTLRWMAYELLEGQGKPTMKSDTWAFGMTVYVSLQSFVIRRCSIREVVLIVTLVAGNPDQTLPLCAY